MSQLEFDRFRFDPSDGRLENTATGAAVTLRPQVARLLSVFLDRPGVVIDRETLYREVWGETAVVDFESGLAALIRELRQALVQAGGEAGLVETMPRRGYRFNKASPAPVRGKRATVAALVAGLVLLVALAAWWLRESAPVPDAPPAAWSLAILPFERYGDPERAPEHAGLLLADALLARLGEREFAQLELIGRASMRPYAGREDVAAAVADDLGVDLLLEGTLSADADGWTVNVRLLRIPPGRVAWSHSLEWTGQDRLPVGESADQLIEQFARDWPDLRAGAGRTEISD